VELHQQTNWFIYPQETLILLAAPHPSGIAWQHLATLKHTAFVAKLLPKGMDNDGPARSHGSQIEEPKTD
jgi:hypothetical protein